jgi:hypothetical protein
METMLYNSRLLAPVATPREEPKAPNSGARKRILDQTVRFRRWRAALCDRYRPPASREQCGGDPHVPSLSKTACVGPGEQLPSGNDQTFFMKAVHS